MNFIEKMFYKKVYIGEVVNLREKYRVNKYTAIDGVPAVYYDIERKTDNKRVGSIDIRFSIDGDMYYYGHIGYNIKKEDRGNNYAYYACKVLFEIAKSEFNMKELLITCSPENIPSYKTLMKLNGELIDFVNVPKYHMLYRFGEKTKYVFKYKL